MATALSKYYIEYMEQVQGDEKGGGAQKEGCQTTNTRGT